MDEEDTPAEREGFALGCELFEVDRRARLASRAGARRETARLFAPPDTPAPKAPSVVTTATIEGFGGDVIMPGILTLRERERPVRERARGVPGFVLYESAACIRPVSGLLEWC